MPVTRQDYEKKSRGMPPRVSRHILVQCLGMSEEDMNKAGFHINWDTIGIDKALNAWSRAKESEVTRAELHHKLAKAVNLGLSESTDWFDFLIPEECQNHPVSSYINHKYANCPCSMEVTERDYSKISRGMPPRMWKHILRECFGIADADLYKAEYKNWFKSIESTICDALITWSQAQEVRVSKRKLYETFVEARNMGLCQTTEWFDFLIDPDCQNQLPTFTETAKPKYKKLPFMQECLVRMLHNPLPIHVMLTSFLIKLFYVGTLTSCAIQFSLYMLLLWGGCINYLVTQGSVIQFFKFRLTANVITTFKQCVISKNNFFKFLMFISAVIHFMLLIAQQNKIVEVLKNKQTERCPIISVTYGIVILMVQTPLLLCLLLKESKSFRFIPNQHIVAVYGQRKHERFFHEIVLSYITWSVGGAIIAYAIRDMASPISVFYISCFTAICIVILWACTLDRDSICLWIDVTTVFCNMKRIVRSSPCSLLLLSFVSFTCYVINFACVIYKAFTPYNTIDLYTISDNSNKLITACLSTLVVLNIQRIFDLYPEERRHPRWEMFVFVLLYVINTCLGVSNFNQCTLLYAWSGSLVFPVSGFMPVDLANLCPATNETVTSMTIMNMTTVHNMTFSGDMVTQPLMP